MAYTFGDHTADAIFTATGRSLEEAFQEATLATTALLIDPSKLRSDVSHSFEITGKRLSTLLYDYIDQILFLLDTEDFLTSKVNVKIDGPDAPLGDCLQLEGDWKLSVELQGQKMTRGEVTGDIKAMTYHNMAIEHTDEGWSLTVVVDI